MGSHYLGDVSYNVRFERQKAQQDIAAIEADWNTAVARMSSKGVTLGVGGGSGGGGGATGGYSGQMNGGNGQPMQGAPAYAPAKSPVQAALNGNSGHWAARFANIPGVTIRDMTGNPIATNSTNASGTHNGQPTPMLGGGGRNFFSSRMGNPSLGGVEDMYGLGALDVAIPQQMRNTQQALRRDARAAQAENKRRMAEQTYEGRVGSLRESLRLQNEVDLNDLRAKQAKKEDAEFDRLRAMDAKKAQDAIDNPGRLGNFETQDIGGLRSNIQTGEITGNKDVGKSKGLLSPSGLRAVKYTAAGLLVYAATNVLGAIEKSMNEGLAAGNDEIKQRMVQRNFGRDLLGSAPLVGGMLTNIFDFAGGGDANRRDIMAIARRGVTEQQGLFRTGTSAVELQTRGYQARSSLFRNNINLQGERDVEIAALEQESREKIRALPPEQDTRRRNGLAGYDNYAPGEGPLARRIAGDYRSRIGAVRNLSASQMDYARMDATIDLFNQQASNENLKSQAALRPVAGASRFIADTALNSFTVNTAYNEKQLDTYRGRKLTPDEMARSSDLELSQRMERAKLGGTIGELGVMRANVLRNIYGGRPTEIGGMQSIEAMRDISPETNEAKLQALSDSIDRLTRAIDAMKGQ